ncbi:lytic polysaccharide monooxygenase auxiliary activity family 9 protein [Goodfellowiella coeruleoviolacea]|uniref:Chitin-binding protein n=1 Tax=Goodfellowiella coeruleoviolacea TaxID=334858 RepID=A0AAE3KK70_9PSEU|nr:lytic polysaccharide monooxygenase [Goodfellowiella coeruleoviolacea]MCP2169069.1 chitin-binding protein [Goodfellowiella coeruleoviolacea]
MLKKQFKRAFGVLVLGLIPLALSVLTAGTAQAHGYTQNPTSRAYFCKLGTATNCGSIQWEPQSVEGPKGFPNSGPADGKLCSAGVGSFAPLDDPRNGTWPTTKLTSGAGYTFTWTLTAPHATSSFRYYITKNGWNPSAPLTRAQLETTPFLTVNMNGQRPGYTVSHPGTLPAGKSGRHLIFSVWDIADTGNAFYQCADVTF